MRQSQRTSGDADKVWRRNVLWQALMAQSHHPVLVVRPPVE
jgi:glucose-6-phosphate dehydrogenase assembly protein OpcA